MKKVIYSLFGFAALSLVSCDYHDPNEGKFGGDSQTGYFVEFEQGGETFIGFDPTVKTDFEVSVPVVLENSFSDLGENVNIDGLTVYYTVEDISGSSDFIVKKGSVLIPKGSLEANIPFTVPANAQGAGCADFVITLSSTSNDKIIVGFDEESVLTHTVHIGPASRDLLIGTYNVTQVTGGVQVQYTVTITAGEDANEFIIHNLNNRGAATNTTAYISSNGEISSPINYLENFLFTAGVQGDVYVANANGVAYCNNISLKFTLRTNAAEIGEVSTVMTKQ